MVPEICGFMLPSWQFVSFFISSSEPHLSRWTLTGMVTSYSNKRTSTGFLNLWATEEFLRGHSLILLNLSRFCKLNVLIENVVSSSAKNIIIRSLVIVLEIIATWKFPHTLPRFAQHAVIESVLRRTGNSCHENEI